VRDLIEIQPRLDQEELDLESLFTAFSAHKPVDTSVTSHIGFDSSKKFEFLKCLHYWPFKQALLIHDLQKNFK